MFRMVEEPSAWIDVEWAGLDDEGYEQKNAIRMQVVFLPLSEVEGVLDGTKADERSVEFAKRVSRGWTEIVGPDKKPFPFTAENLEKMFELTPGFAIGFVLSYLKAYRGKGRIREGNSAGSPADGQAGAAEEAKTTA